MPEHPIDERADSHIRKVWWKESPDTRFGFGAGARFGYDAAKAEFTERLSALESALAEVERLKAGKLAELCREISDFSEESYCAGWMGGIEDDLPRLCAKVIETGRPHHYGQATVTVERAKYFTQLAADAGSWVDMDGNRYEPKVKP